MAPQEPLLPLTASRLEVLTQATERYEMAAMFGETLPVWGARRGLTTETLHGFRLGVVDNPIPGHEGQVGYIAIPYINAAGMVVQIRFRCPEDHSCKEHGHPKYKTEAGDPVRLFNVGALNNPSLEIHLCEGEVDAMTLTQLGLTAVGLPGVSSFCDRHRVLLQGYERVWIWGDGDDAGRSMARELQRTLRNSAPIPVPDGMDVNALYLSGEEKAIKDLIAEGRKLYG